ASVSQAFDDFQRGWQAEFGEGIPLPSFSPATTRDFRVTSRAVRVDDAAITDLSGESVIRTEGPLGGPEDVGRLDVARRGAGRRGRSRWAGRFGRRVPPEARRAAVALRDDAGYHGSGSRPAPRHAQT